MPKQQYSNHVRYYVPHHFIFYPLVMALLFICIKIYRTAPEKNNIWLVLAALTLLLAWLSFMVRQHYALNNQNRIVRLEMRLRYYILTHIDFAAIEKRLSFQQLAALRFAADEELLVLIDRTLKEQLSPDTIKKSIKHWQPDDLRV